MKTVEQFLKENGIKKENLLYLPIAEPFFSNILNGTKKVEFRSITEFYLRKLCKYNGEEFVEYKPVKYIDFRNGYAKNARRAIVELKDWFFRDEESKPLKDSDLPDYIKEEITSEGFTDGDDYLAFVLGEVVATENL